MTFPALSVLLAGNDVSAYASGTLTVVRGRLRHIDQYQAGTASVDMRNEARAFDPTNASGPFYPQPLPRATLSVSLAGNKVFSGYLDDYNLGYEMPARSTTTLAGIDGLSLLAAARLSNYAAAQELSGSRITHILSASRYPGATSIDAGQSMLQASVVDGVSVLDHAHIVEASEDGMLFCDRTGKLCFQDRLFQYQQAAAYPNGQMTFTDTGVSYNGPCIGYSALSIADVTTLLFNVVTGQRNGGDPQTVSDAASITAYLTRTLALPTLENFADAEVLDILYWYLLNYSNPEIRFAAITTEISGLSGATQAALTALDIGSVVIGERTPPGGGARITQLSMVEGIGWTYDSSSKSCQLTLALQNLTTDQFFTLDDAVNGILDTSKLFY